MNTAFLNYRTLTRYAALAVTLLLGMFFASQIHGQEIEILSEGSGGPISVLEPGELQQIVVPQEVIVDQQIVDQPFVDQSVSLVEPVKCQSSGPQVIKTKEICPLKKTLVCVAGQDEIWLVSARKSHLCSTDLLQVQTCSLQNEAWHSASLEQLTAQHTNDKSKVTFVYCHGNRTDLSWAKSRGLQVYQSLFEEKCDQERPPVRFVIFAWKSEQEKIRLRPDYQIKSKRAPIVGKTFGRFLGQFSDRDMVLSGFSLGSQVILTGLSGCESAGCDLPGRYQLALVAPALEASFVCGSLGRLADNALVKRTEVFASEKDRAIKAAQKIAAKTCREWLPEFKKLERSNNCAPNPIVVNDVGPEISRQHSTKNYYGSAIVQCIHLEMLNQVAAAQSSSVPVLAPLAPEEFEPDYGQINAGLESIEATVVVPELTAPVEMVAEPVLEAPVEATREAFSILSE